jgi:ADP-heptose:LPS heptosyltransferase
MAADGVARLRAVWRLLVEMRARGIDGGRYARVIIFHRDWRYGAVARLAGIPVRIGFDAGLGRRFLTRAYAPSPRQHHVDQYLSLVEEPAPASIVSWQWRDGERAAALDKAAGLGFTPGARPWVALGFGGGRNVKTQTDLKQWPLERFRDLADALTARGCDVVWVGDAADAARLGSAIPTGLVLAGRLTVGETAAVLSSCVHVVANDSLLMHLAGAVGVPVTGIFGPTDPALYGPRGAGSGVAWMGERLSCSPCEVAGTFPPCAFAHRCMMELDVATVLEQLPQGWTPGPIRA